MALSDELWFLDDKRSRAALIAEMPKALRDEYNSYGWTVKEAGFPGRVLVVYTLRAREPTDLDIITLWDFRVGEDGPELWAASDDQGKFLIGAIPMKWRGRDVFFQIPQEFIFKWRGKPMPNAGVEFAAHFAILIRTRSKESDQVEGATYCATLNDFRARFPKVQIKY